MASYYRALLLGFILATTLVSCYALPAELTASSEGNTDSAEENSVIEITLPDIESDVESDAVTNQLDDEDESKTNLETDVEGITATSAQQDEEQDLSEGTSAEEKAETLAADDDADVQVEAAATEAAAVAEGSSAASGDSSDNDDTPSYTTSSYSDGHHNFIHVAGGLINETLNVSAYLPLLTLVKDGQLVIPHLAYSDSSDKLVVLTGGQCVEHTYSAEGAVSARNMTAEECREVVTAMRRVEGHAAGEGPGAPPAAGPFGPFGPPSRSHHRQPEGHHHGRHHQGRRHHGNGHRLARPTSVTRQQ